MWSVVMGGRLLLLCGWLLRMVGCYGWLVVMGGRYGCELADYKSPTSYELTGIMCTVYFILACGNFSGYCI